MTTTAAPEDEKARLAAVRRYEILDTPADRSFDRITNLAAELFDVPIALVTIVDHDRIWFKSRHGLDAVEQIDRDPGLCASAILSDEPYVVEAAREDPARWQIRSFRASSGCNSTLRRRFARKAAGSARCASSTASRACSHRVRPRYCSISPISWPTSSSCDWRRWSRSARQRAEPPANVKACCCSDAPPACGQRMSKQRIFASVTLGGCSARSALVYRQAEERVVERVRKPHVVVWKCHDQRWPPIQPADPRTSASTAVVIQ